MDNISTIFKLLEKEIAFEPIITKLARKNASRFEILVATMMSARTKDEVTELAAERLFNIANTPDKILKIDINKLEKIIYPVGFYKTKAKHLQQLCSIIIKEHKGVVPDSMEGLQTLPGVGLKTAALVLSEGFGLDEICVDTHVHRISNRLGIIKTKKPTESYFELKKMLPKKYWRKINFLMVSYGKTICAPVSPKCSICSLNKICPKIGVKNKR
ncbi:MAG: endonuclease III [bacterium]